MQIKKDWKFYLGLIFFFYSWVPYLIAILLLAFNIPIKKTLMLLGVFIASAEISFALSIILLGKPFLQYLKTHLKEMLLRSSALPPQPISKTRHYTGITLLLLSFLPYFITEISLFLGYPKTDSGHLILFLMLLSSDAVFIISLFVLGGDFWNRLQNLFKWQGDTPIPNEQND